MLKYQFIVEHKGKYPVTLMCQALEVSTSGYYAPRKSPGLRPKSKAFSWKAAGFWQPTHSCCLASAWYA
jgi:hypothetical protein